MIPAFRSHTPTALSARVAFVGLNPGRMGLGKDCLEHETAIKKDETNERSMKPRLCSCKTPGK